MFNRLTPHSGAAFLFLLIPGAAIAEVDLAEGRTIFNETAQPPCAVCHALSDAGAEAEIGPNLDEFKPTVAQVRAAVTSGIGVMPAFSETLTEAEIEAVSQYVSQVTGGDSAAAPQETPEETASADASVDLMPGAELLAMGDATAGERTFRRCAACHTVDEGGANRVGPNLYGIVGAPVAAVPDYDYSDALIEYAGIWSPDRLAAFLANPRGEVRGTNMGFAGLRKEQDIADVMAYLAQLSSAE
ncbi:MAG TPA: cytochrome C552 [Sulfitobacter sp.]|nr:cytochrome C552 [Roseovarius sp.]MBD13518.1 cytochrome C552 [Roseovarius sp.]HCQ59593.1 cytochrome C552 [Sulfitobacter sp.]|tara:strand:+ start:788 stop:1519 length:732 start_codon:yes stop_codon:yes gene_type:complete